MTYFFLFGATLLYVFLRAFQQKNVQHNKYLWMVPVSYGMALCDVYLITSIAGLENTEILLAALSLGTGGSIGAISAAYLHTRIHNEQ